MTDIQDKTCKNCGDQFKPKRRNQQYCCQIKTSTCPICGKEFTYRCDSFVPKTCSTVCQGLLAKQQRKLKLAATKRICKWCGAEFTPQDFRDEYCHNKHFKKCAVCGKEFEIDVRKNGQLNETCSKECKAKLAVANHNYTKGVETLKKTLLDKYGVDNAMRIPGSKDKIKQTNLEKYGAEWYTQTAEYKEQAKQTDLEKYGVEHHLQSSSVIDKRTDTVRKKYNVSNVFQADEIKSKTKQTLNDGYGVNYVSQYAEFKAKATKNSRNSKLEQRICYLLSNYNIEYVHHYSLSNERYSHEFDFYLPSYNLLIDADGLYFHSYLDDPDGVRVREDYDEVRLELVPENCRFKVIVEGSEDSQIKELVQMLEESSDSLSKMDSQLFTWCRSIDFPYPKYEDKRMLSDFSHLSAYENDKYVSHCRLGQSLIKNFHRSIYSCRVRDNVSPLEGWYDDNKLKQTIRNRLIYKNDVDPAKILAGFNLSKICPSVSTFNPVLARYLIKKYLAEFNIIFDPFSGFSGRLLGAASLDKAYIGQDLNSKAVDESNQIIDFLKLDRSQYSVSCKDILQSEGEFECLLTCPPYNKKEIYNKETVFKPCDEWIDECLSRFKCRKYVFVVDETEKYRNNVVETIESSSHLTSAVECVIVIEE